MTCDCQVRKEYDDRLDEINLEYIGVLEVIFWKPLKRRLPFFIVLTETAQQHSISLKPPSLSSVCRHIEETKGIDTKYLKVLLSTGLDVNKLIVAKNTRSPTLVFKLGLAGDNTALEFLLNSK